ncbi:MAG: hypothetical protein WAO35_10625 [Terriglobia bacterium]
MARAFGDDALGYFTKRLPAAPTRAALATALRQAQRHKAFDGSTFIAWAVDGTTVGRGQQSACTLCRPHGQNAGQITSYHYHPALVSDVGTGLTLPFDVEPRGPGNSEYAAGQRLLRCAVNTLRPRFADHVVVIGEFATAPFLHAGGDLHLRVAVRLTCATSPPARLPLL